MGLEAPGQNLAENRRRHLVSPGRPCPVDGSEFDHMRIACERSADGSRPACNRRRLRDAARPRRDERAPRAGRRSACEAAYGRSEARRPGARSRCGDAPQCRGGAYGRRDLGGRRDPGAARAPRGRARAVPAGRAGAGQPLARRSALHHARGAVAARARDGGSPGDPEPAAPRRGRARPVLAHEARAARSARALGRARRALPGVLPRRSPRARDVREPLPALGSLARNDARASLRGKSLPGGPGVRRDDRERLRARRPVARGRRRALAVHARDREDLRPGDRPLAGPAPRARSWRPTRRPTSWRTSTAASAAGTSPSRPTTWATAAWRRSCGATTRTTSGRSRAPRARCPGRRRYTSPRSWPRPSSRTTSRAFGFGDLQVDPPVESDEVDVPPGTPLSLVAQAAGCALKDVEALNPELRAARTPPRARATRRFRRRCRAARARRRRRGSRRCAPGSRRSTGTWCDSARHSIRSRRRTRRAPRTWPS